MKHKTGVIISKILMEGPINALAGQIRGIVDVMSCKSILLFCLKRKMRSSPAKNDLTLFQLRFTFATRLHAAISARFIVECNSNSFC